MSRKCPTGKGVLVGNRVSHSNRKTKHRFYPNLQKKRFWSDSRKRFVTMRVSTSAIRTITKIGVDKFIRANSVQVD